MQLWELETIEKNNKNFDIEENIKMRKEKGMILHKKGKRP